MINEVKSEKMISNEIQYWLLKSEPDTFSLDDLKRVNKEPWTGVRNYLARNYMMQMKKGDLCFFYHSSCEIPAIVGTCMVSREYFPDPTQFDEKSEYFDSKARKDMPRWQCIEAKFLSAFAKILPLSLLRQNCALQNMKLLQKGSRLSVLPVTKEEYLAIVKML